MSFSAAPSASYMRLCSGWEGNHSLLRLTSESETHFISFKESPGTSSKAPWRARSTARDARLGSESLTPFQSVGSPMSRTSAAWLHGGIPGFSPFFFFFFLATRSIMSQLRAEIARLCLCHIPPDTPGIQVSQWKYYLTWRGGPQVRLQDTMPIQATFFVKKNGPGSQMPSSYNKG